MDDLARRQLLRHLFEDNQPRRQPLREFLVDNQPECAPCEFCHELIPLDALILHETRCRPDLACGIDLTFEEIEAQSIALETLANEERSTVNFPEIPEQNILPNIGFIPDLADGIDLTEEELAAQLSALETFVNKKRSTTNSLETPSPQDQNISPNVNTSTAPKLEVEKTTLQKDKRDEFNTDDHFVIPEDDIIQDNETTFTFGSSKKEKRGEEEEKPSFKAPLNPILNNDFKQIYHNHLTESDNEDGESLEDFWKRADIKLSQRLRMIQHKTMGSKGEE